MQSSSLGTTCPTTTFEALTSSVSHRISAYVKLDGYLGLDRELWTITLGYWTHMDNMLWVEAPHLGA